MAAHSRVGQGSDNPRSWALFAGSSLPFRVPSGALLKELGAPFTISRNDRLAGTRRSFHGQRLGTCPPCKMRLVDVRQLTGNPARTSSNRQIGAGFTSHGFLV